MSATFSFILFALFPFISRTTKEKTCSLLLFYLPPYFFLSLDLAPACFDQVA